MAAAADKRAQKEALMAKYKGEIKAALPEITDVRWADAKTSLTVSANKLVILKGKDKSEEEIEAKKAEIINDYKKEFKIGQEDQGRPRSRSVSRGPAKTTDQREAELRAAAAAAKERAEKISREANEKLAKELAALEQSQAKGALKKAADNVARANSAAVKELAETLMEEASRNIEAAWKEVGRGKALPEAYKPGLAKARAMGVRSNNETLKNIKADDYIGRCRFCSKFCHSTRKNGAKKNGANANKSANAAPAAAAAAPARGRSRAARPVTGARGRSQAPPNANV
jgi:hypothetical protein